MRSRSPSSSSEASSPVFRGPEHGRISAKDQKKIVIDIQRRVPEADEGDSKAIKRDIRDPVEFILPRRRDEGKRGIFDREDIKHWKDASEFAGPEKRPKIVAVRPDPIDKYEAKLRSGGGGAGKNFDRRRLGMKEDEDDLRRRLDGDNRKRKLPSSVASVSSKQFRSDGRLKNDSVHARLGGKVGGGRSGNDDDYVLARRELESKRPEVKPWDVNPEFVPRGRNYYEHDNREDDFDRGGFPGRRPASFHRGRGQLRNRSDYSDPYSRREERGRSSYRGGRGFNRRSRSDALYSMEWKHDKYSELMNESNGDRY